ncbi:MAG: nucleotide exchange factor GrpE, partial [Nitrososphaera sp.]
SEKEFEITEKPIPLYGWKPDDGQDRLRIIEQDTRNLMRQFAEAKLSLTEQERLHIDKTKRLLLAIVEVTDAFERVFSSIHTKEDQINRQMKMWIANFRSVRRLLDELLTELGVAKIENLDQGFDPLWHKVADIVIDASQPDGTIVEEAEKGYLWQKQILRKAGVVVVRNTDENSP